MKRRDFLVSSAALGLGLTSSRGEAGAAEPTGGKDILDLRIYHFSSPEQMRAFEDFVGKAAVPAIQRAGVGPVGVFKVLREDNRDLKDESQFLSLYVLRTHRTLESFLLLPRRMAGDAEFRKDAAGIWDAPKSNPPYSRYEVRLLLSFDAVPRVETPAKGPDRLLQLRIYESHSEERAIKKIQMFNTAEVAVFRRCGVNPVFFGQTLAGTNLPNLQYMTGYQDKAAQEKAWAAFGKDPEWNKLKADPEYKDTVISETIVDLLMRPAAGSEI